MPNKKSGIVLTLCELKQKLDPIIREDGTVRNLFVLAATIFVLAYNYLKYHYDLGYYSLFLGVPKELIEKPDLQAISLNIFPAIIVLILIIFSYYVAFHFVEFVNQTWPNKWKTYKWICFAVLALGMFGLQFLRNKFIANFDWDFAYCFVFFFISFLVISLLFDKEINPIQDDSAEDKKMKWSFRWMFILFAAFIIAFWLFLPHSMQKHGQRAANRELTFSTIMHDTLFTEAISSTPPGFDGECDYVVLYTTSDHYIIAPYSISQGNASNKKTEEMIVYNEYIVVISKDDRFLKMVTVDKITTNTSTPPSDAEHPTISTEAIMPEETTLSIETIPEETTLPTETILSTS